jgi:hypothetical protein
MQTHQENHTLTPRGFKMSDINHALDFYGLEH